MIDNGCSKSYILTSWGQTYNEMQQNENERQLSILYSYYLLVQNLIVTV